MSKKALIIGVSGQDGVYLAKFLLENGYKVFGTVRKINKKYKYRIKYLKIENLIQHQFCNILNIDELNKVVNKIDPDEIYNLAAQSSVSKSFIEPFKTLNFNSMSTLNLLEVVYNYPKKIKFLQAVSSDIYGNTKTLPINESSIIQPKSPYAISKTFGYWAVKNFREKYNLFCVNAILFNHESYLRESDFFVKKVIKSSILIKNKKLDVLKVGNIDIVRDFGYAPEYVKAMWLMLQNNKPEDYCICSGKSISLRKIIEYVFNKLEISLDKLIIDKSYVRSHDIFESYGDNSKIKKKLKWEYDMSFFTVLDILIKEEVSNFSSE